MSTNFLFLLTEMLNLLTEMLKLEISYKNILFFTIFKNYFIKIENKN